MNPSDYQRACERTECDQHKSRLRINGVITDTRTLESTADVARQSNGSEVWVIPTRMIHAVIGLAGETGELASVLQKWLYFGKPYTQDELRQKIKDEGGDVCWYLAELFNAVGLDMGEVMRANAAKLEARYPEKFTEERAADENRNREAESQAVSYPGRGQIGGHVADNTARECTKGGLHIWAGIPGLTIAEGVRCEKCGEYSDRTIDAIRHR